MSITTNEPNAIPLNLERELVCFICTEIAYQPLTLFDCLHFFCGACLKEWFSYQHRKASSSHSSSSSTNPYTCPTCRASVKDARPNAWVNTLLDAFLSANPNRRRTEEEKSDMALIYKPGDNILPKVESRRRERRGRRDAEAADARERQMIEEARERSLRELQTSPTTSQNHLQVPSSRQPQSSRSRDRDERRQRRRDQERRDQRQHSQPENLQHIRDESANTDQRIRESTTAEPPVTSPRHPEAVEARQRQQTVVHQASLTSLISSSENSTGSSSNDSLSEAHIMQEILRMGLLDGIDIDAMTETEQDALAQHIADAVRQQRLERNQRNSSASRNTQPISTNNNPPTSNNLQVEDQRHHRRTESGSRNRRADTLPSSTAQAPPATQPRAARIVPSTSSNSLPPTSSVVLTHRTRASSQDRRGEASRNTSRPSSPTSRSTNARSRSSTGIDNRPPRQDQVDNNTNVEARAPQRLTIEPRGPVQMSEVQAHRGTTSNDPSSTGDVSTNNPPSQPVTSSRSQNIDTIGATTQPSQRNMSPTVSAPPPRRRASGLYDEPSISCFRCHRADIQYEIYRHCDKCDINLCGWCYRSGRGCKHWNGFGRAAMLQFEAAQSNTTEQMELPHMLIIGRQYERPDPYSIIRSKLAKDGTTIVPLQTTSNPVNRFLEGRFCDRCGNFANSCIWSCDHCNWGEWGFCRDCVNTHHCCTHPLSASVHKAHAPASQSARPMNEHINPTSGELLTATSQRSPAPSQPGSATSAFSATAGPLPDFIHLNITTGCDICSQSIPPSAYRYHCPFHPSPTPTDPDARGDYDICTSCYHNLVKTNRIKRDDGPAGWRKCPSGHRMIIIALQDYESIQRRVVLHDLVGGWETPEEAMRKWNAELETRRQQGTIDLPSSPLLTPSEASRRFARTRTGSYSNDPTSPSGTSPFSSSSRFPPEGGSGLRGFANWPNFLEDPVTDADKEPRDLVFPRGAEIREIKIDDDYPEWCGGVYAGDRGLLPTGYLTLGT